MAVRLLVSGVLLASLMAPAAAETRYRGAVVFTATKNCTANDAQVGWKFKSEFHPRLAGNGDFSAISLVYEYGAIGHKLNGANFTSTYATVKSGGVGWGDAYTPDKRTSVLVSSQQPQTIKSGTETVFLVGKFKNVWGQTGAEGCEVTFNGAYVQLVN
jgi:hypothetical protein